MAEATKVVEIAKGRGLNVQMMHQFGNPKNPYLMRLMATDGKTSVFHAIVSDYGQAMDQLERWQAQLEIAPYAEKPQAQSETKKSREFGKLYKNKGVIFRYADPEALSPKQRKVVHRFMRRVDGNLMGIEEGRKFADFAPWIDLMFQMFRGEIFQSDWNRITKIELDLSTFDDMHDHNM